MKHNKRGFTLIELLVVVLIIGILAAIAMPQYEKAVLKSRYTQAKLLASSLAQAQEIYYMANGSFIPDISALAIDLPTPRRTAPLALEIPMGIPGEAVS